MFHQTEELIRLLEDLQIFTTVDGQFNPDEDGFFSFFSKLADELIIDDKPYIMGEFDQVSTVFFKCQQIFKCMGVNDFTFFDLFGEDKQRSKKLLYQLCQSLQIWRGHDMQIWRNRFDEIRSIDEDVGQLKEDLIRTKESYQNILQEMSNIKEAVLRHENSKQQLQSKLIELSQQLESAQYDLEIAQDKRQQSFDKRTKQQQIIISLERDINNLNKKIVQNPTQLVDEQNILENKIRQLKEKEIQLIKQVKMQSLCNKLYNLYEQQLDELLQNVDSQESVQQMANTMRLKLNTINENIYKLQDDIAQTNNTIKDLKLQQKLAEEENQEKEKLYTQEIGVKRDDVQYLEQYALQQGEATEQLKRKLHKQNAQLEETHLLFLQTKRAIKKFIDDLDAYEKDKTTYIEQFLNVIMNQCTQLTEQFENLEMHEIEDQETL